MCHHEGSIDCDDGDRVETDPIIDNTNGLISGKVGLHDSHQTISCYPPTNLLTIHANWLLSIESNPFKILFSHNPLHE